ALANTSKQIYFNHLLALHVGENNIRLDARDQSGKKVILELTIIRQQPFAIAHEQRLILADIPMRTLNNADSSIANWNDQALHNALVSQKRFRIVNRRQLKLLLPELHFSSSSLIDNKSKLQLGNVLAAHVYTNSSMVRWPDGIEIVTWLVDVETGNMISNRDIFTTHTEPEHLRTSMQELAFKLKQSLPLLQANISNSDTKQVQIDKGANFGLRKGMRLLAFTEQENGKQNIIAELQITQVDAKNSYCRIIHKQKSLANEHIISR
ncbi:MAG: hypothetical protein R8L53_05490, partial [Mariprofundales bacterium]